MTRSGAFWTHGQDRLVQRAMRRMGAGVGPEVEQHEDMALRGNGDARCSQDMLDLAYGACETSRLGCQVKLHERMQGLVLTVPSDANNIMDDIPFPDR